MDNGLDIEKDDLVYSNFKSEFEKYILSSKLNNIVGLDNFLRTDICMGCTQFIDSIYMKDFVQVVSGDYRYHERLNPKIEYSIPTKLVSNIPLI